MKMACQGKPNNDLVKFAGDLSLIQDTNYRHMLITGISGAGKSMLLSYALEKAREYPAVIFDCYGEHLSKFWRPGDRILNPLDSRSEYWTPWAEIRSPHHANEIAKSLVHMREGHDPVWLDAARVLLEKGLNETRTRSVADLLRNLQKMANMELSGLSCLSEAAARISEDLKPTQVAYVTLLSRCVCLKYLWQPGPEPEFSLRDWVKAPKGWLFITSSLVHNTDLNPLLSNWLELLASELLFRPMVPDLKMCFVIDGLSDLQPLPTLQRLIENGRSRGLTLLTAFRTISQLKEAWGKYAAESFCAQADSLISFEADRLTAKFLEKAYGPPFSSKHFQRLPKGQAFVRISEPPFISQIQIGYRGLPEVVPALLHVNDDRNCWSIDWSLDPNELPS